MKELSFLEHLDALTEDELSLIEESVEWERHWRYLQKFPLDFCDAVHSAVKEKQYEDLLPYLNKYNEVVFRPQDLQKIKCDEIKSVEVRKSFGNRKLFVQYSDWGWQKTFDLEYLSDPDRHRRMRESQIEKVFDEDEVV